MSAGLGAIAEDRDEELMKTAPHAASPRRISEVLFEFSAIGNSVKVCAVDPLTMREVSISGPVTAGEEALKRAALKKLLYVLNGPKLAAVDGLKRGVSV